MRMIAAFALTAACMVAGGVMQQDVSLPSDVTVAERNFEFTYLTKGAGLPAGAKRSRLWIPLPQSDTYQAISDLKIESPLAFTRHRDSQYGNEFLYFEIPPAESAQSWEVHVTFRAARREHRVALDKPEPHPQSPGTSPASA